MRYAIVSDIHANLQAWTAVLQDIARHRIDAILCLGDVVGYGPNPQEVLQSVRQHVDTLLLGNHDAALCGMIAPVQFNTHALAILDWTQRVLPP
jgi:predicted phosphodiesterase